MRGAALLCFALRTTARLRALINAMGVPGKSLITSYPRISKELKYWCDLPSNLPKDLKPISLHELPNSIRCSAKILSDRGYRIGSDSSL